MADISVSHDYTRYVKVNELKLTREDKWQLKYVQSDSVGHPGGQINSQGRASNDLCNDLDITVTHLHNNFFYVQSASKVHGYRN